MDNSVDNRFPRGRQARWDADNLVTVSTHIRRDMLISWRHACLVAGVAPYTALRDFVLRFIDEPLGGPPPAALA